jgi:multiple sugar transport system ATP-binding protein
MNLVEVPLVDGGVKFGGSVVNISREDLAGAGSDKAVTVGIRPEHFEIVPSGGIEGVAVTVNVVEELGADGFVYGTTKIGGEDRDIVVRVHGRQVPQKGETIHVVPTGGEAHVFSSSTGERLSS